MNVVVNKKTELAAIFIILSNYKEIYPELIASHQAIKSYNININNYFSKFKDHKLIKLFGKLVVDYQFSYGAPIELFLNLNEDFSYNEDIVFAEETLLSEYITTAESKKMFKIFLDGIYDFVKEINFDNYYENNLPFYNYCVDTAKKPLLKYNIQENLSQMFNTEKFYEETEINLLPFTHGNFGLTIQGIPSPNYGIDNIQDEFNFGTKYPNLVAHELLHPKINPLTKENLDVVEKFDFSSSKKNLKEYAHVVSNSSILNEYFVRALELIVTKSFWETEGRFQSQIKKNIDYGFVHINWLINKLVEKTKFNNIEDVFPQVLNEFLDYVNFINMQIRDTRSYEKLEKYMNEDLNNPKYMFHGSNSLNSILEIRKSHDDIGTLENIDTAIFITPSISIASAYAFKDSIKDANPNLKYSFTVKNYEEYPIMTMSNIEFEENHIGYIYVFEYSHKYKNEPVGSHQYKSYVNLSPIDIIPIRYKNFEKLYINLGKEKESKGRLKWKKNS